MSAAVPSLIPSIPGARPPPAATAAPAAMPTPAPRTAAPAAAATPAATPAGAAAAGVCTCRAALARVAAQPLHHLITGDGHRRHQSAHRLLVSRRPAPALCRPLRQRCSGAAACATTCRLPARP